MTISEFKTDIAQQTIIKLCGFALQIAIKDVNFLCEDNEKHEMFINGKYFHGVHLSVDIDLMTRTDAYPAQKS